VGAANLSFANAIAINATGGTIDVGNDTVRWTGNITNGSGTTPGSLTIISSVGNGVVFLAPTSPGANTNSGATIIGDGTHLVALEGGATNAFSALSAVTVNAGSYLNLGGHDQIIGSLAGAGTVQDAGGIGTTHVLTTGGNNSSTTFSGLINDGGGGSASTRLEPER
jgi:hypothetical protein